MQPTLRATHGTEKLAQVFVLQFGDDKRHVIETVDSIDPRYSRREKAVIIVSTQFGCTVGCSMCEAGGHYHGNLTTQQILDQVRFVMDRRPENRLARKLKVHLARMGEPSCNGAVLRAVAALPDLVQSNGLIACISTVAPRGSVLFFELLLAAKRRYYRPGQFQLQLSINSTDPEVQKRLMRIQQLDPVVLSTLGRRFHDPGDRKVVLNFALGANIPVDPGTLRRAFDPEHFIVKLTPINPTARAGERGLHSVLTAQHPDAAARLVEALQSDGFQTLVSIGEPEEIRIGSNCGQLVAAHQIDRHATSMPRQSALA